MKDDESIESRVRQAMRSRAQHFRDLADSLTFEGARRLLEKDLNLDTHALDKHKKYVKQLLEKILSGTEDEDNVSKNTKQIKSEKVKKEEEDKPKEQKVTDDNEGIIEDSPVMGLLSGTKSSKSENPKTEDKSEDKIPTEDMIKEAIWKKATYFRSKSEELTVAGVRRLIEEDLELKKFSLDPFKKLISKQLDEVLNSQSDTPNKTGSKSDSESEDMEVEVKPKKKPAVKTKVQKSEAPKKRKKSLQETEQPKKKKMKNVEETSVKKKKVVKDADEDSSSEKSEPSAEKSEKKEVAAPIYGKKVERLKSIIKACGMSVAPSVYRKAKQASEDKREAFLVEELKEILSKEGLSANPSEKEIKEVKRRKERAKELEGIDTSNIVSGSRRRSTFNFVAPPKPKAPIESDGDESEDSDNDDGDDSEDTGNEDVDGDDQEVDDKDGDDKDDDKDDKDGDDEKDEDDADDKDGEDDVNDGDDKDEDDKVDDSKSEEVTGNDEVV